MPGVVLGACIRVFAIPGPRVFRLVVPAVLLPLGIWLCARALRAKRPDRPPLSRRTTLGCRELLRERNIVPRIARPGIESSKRLGRHRYVIECCLEWTTRFRHLVRRYERKASHFLDFRAWPVP